MDFGYVRVSSKDQNPDRQIKIMLDLGIEERNIYVEKKSGHTFNRETYDMLVNHIIHILIHKLISITMVAQLILQQLNMILK